MVWMKIGTLSGLDVLTVGKVEPGATIELEDGSQGVVQTVKGRRLTSRGVVRGSVEVRMRDGSLETVASSEIAAVLREAPSESSTAASGHSSVVGRAIGPAGV
jgi:hypothetical protein